jgi:hypothetical protein
VRGERRNVERDELRSLRIESRRSSASVAAGMSGGDIKRLLYREVQEYAATQGTPLWRGREVEVEWAHGRGSARIGPPADCVSAVGLSPLARADVEAAHRMTATIGQMRSQQNLSAVEELARHMLNLADDDPRFVALAIAYVGHEEREPA